MKLYQIGEAKSLGQHKDQIDLAFLYLEIERS